MIFALSMARRSPIVCTVLAVVIHMAHVALGAPGLEGIEQAIMSTAISAETEN